MPKGEEEEESGEHITGGKRGSAEIYMALHRMIGDDFFSWRPFPYQPRLRNRQRENQGPATAKAQSARTLARTHTHTHTHNFFSGPIA